MSYRSGKNDPTQLINVYGLVKCKYNNVVMRFSQQWFSTMGFATMLVYIIFTASLIPTKITPDA